MSYHYSHEDNEIASSIEERIHAMRNYKAALRSRRASEGSRDAEEIHDDEPQTLEESHAVDQQNNEPTRTVEGFRVVHFDSRPPDTTRDTDSDAVHPLEE
ncbi:hypothetical protein F9C07_2242155 [Aspergillus flavus]|uniref:Uncharacterized protein n=2 Tax=Aspergillus flavus TaxID=5059 RepID=A0A7U2QUW6_ASPFN|nr:hypothetical protein AFLA_006477 [Aspergillus flavus NRRL3357]KAJ1705360.1 hypothetical protein NYO67_12485 [Aspergillus flavus]QRD85242.1 hypothetical protein F9C07_2242155 [Aspergillus flavus]RAQ41999.1 hypothetical protein AFGD_000906 [Aspergillus flavus]RAQ57875.1 hypothetical protein COH20_004303 [Aspergillus flavus]